MLNTLKVGENCNVSSNFQTNVKFKAIERVIFFIVKICFLIKIWVGLIMQNQFY